MQAKITPNLDETCLKRPMTRSIVLSVRLIVVCNMSTPLNELLALLHNLLSLSHTQDTTVHISAVSFSNLRSTLAIS